MAILCLEIVVILLGHSLVTPLLSLYAQSFGATVAMIGLVSAVPGLTRLLTNVPIGRLADRVGRRPMLVGGPFLICGTALMAGLAPSYWWLVAARGLHGFGSGMYLTAASVVVADIAPPTKRGRMMSMQQGSMLLGQSLGPTLGGFIAEYFNYRAAFFVYAVLVLCAGVWAYLRIPETRDWKNAGQQPEQAKHRAEVHEPKRVSARGLLLDVNFVLVSLIGAVVLFTRGGAQLTVVPLLGSNRLGISPGQIGLAFTIFSVVDFSMIYAAGFIADRFGRKVAIVPAGFVSAAGLVLYVLSPSYPVFLAATVLLGVGTGIAGPAPSAYVADLARQGSYGLIFGVYRTAGDLGFVLGGLALGSIADGGGLSTSLLVNAALVAGSASLFGLLARESVPKEAQAPVVPGLATKDRPSP